MSKETTTIIYITDNSLDEKTAFLCRDYLQEAAGDRRIISVSQYPIQLGENIPSGYIGRSLYSILRQIAKAVSIVETPLVAFAEHDVIYPPEHFDYQPSNEEAICFNINSWYVHLQVPHYGQYTKRNKRFRPFTQMITSKKTMDKLIDDRAIAFIKEPKVRFDPDESEGKWSIETFETKRSVLDLKHKTNFASTTVTGSMATYVHKDYGVFDNVLNRRFNNGDPVNNKNESTKSLAYQLS